MSKPLRNSSKKVHLALAGAAALMLGGCAETAQLTDPFASPFKTASRVDPTPTGTVAQPQAPNLDPSGFFAEAFRPFGDQPAAPPAARPPRVAAPTYTPPQAPIPVQSAPLAPPSVASLPTPVAPAPVSLARSAPNAVGGWTAEGGVPMVVAQGESVESIATRFGVPASTLLSLNGFSSRAQVQPGTRLTIPVYHASGAAARVASAPALPQVSAPKLPVPTPVVVKPALAAAAPALAAPRLATPDPAAQFKAAQVKADAEAKAQAKKLTEAKAAQMKIIEARAAELKAKEAQKEVQKEMQKAEAEKARAVKEAAAKQVVALKAAAPNAAAVKTAAVKTAAARTAEVAAAPVEAAAKLEAPAKLASAAKQQVAAVAPVTAPVPAGKFQASAPAPVAAAPADATASLPAPASVAAASESANPEFRWPARGRVIQGFGSGGNDGINIAVPEGTQVKAAEGGVVAYAGSELKGYGNLVLIRHPNGFVSAYANNGSINVKRGETVKRGQTIALSGQTGNVASPQLHFELRKGQKPVDPSAYLAGL